MVSHEAITKLGFKPEPRLDMGEKGKVYFYTEKKCSYHIRLITFRLYKQVNIIIESQRQGIHGEVFMGDPSLDRVKFAIKLIDTQNHFKSLYHEDSTKTK